VRIFYKFLCSFNPRFQQPLMRGTLRGFPKGPMSSSVTSCSLCLARREAHINPLNTPFALLLQMPNCPADGLIVVSGTILADHAWGPSFS
jgi:hypothetical protein